MTSIPVPTSPADPPPPATRGMPRALTLVLGVAAVAVATQALQPIQSTIAAAFMALNIVIVVWPVQRWLGRHVPRGIAALAAGVLALGLLAAMVWSIGWTIARLVRELPQYSGRFSTLISHIGGYLGRLRADNEVVQLLWVQLQTFNLSSITGTLTALVSNLTSLVTLLVTVLMILVFMVIDSAGFSDRIQRLGERHNPTLAWALGSFARGTRKYWVVTTVFGLIVATCNWVLLVALGVPMPFLWALLSFTTNYIPNIGFVIGVIPPAIMALLVGDPWTALWVVVGYIVFNMGIQTFIQPKFTGDAVGITPTVTVLSLLLWAYVLGPLGAILAIPATLLVKTVLVDIDPRTRWVNSFIASNPTTSDQDPIRLSHLLARAKTVRRLPPGRPWSRGARTERGGGGVGSAGVHPTS